jgi:serine/threonine protein kinase
LGAPSLLRKVERRLFLRLRDQAPGVREAELAKLPMVVRNRVQMLLQHFDHVESNEDERTRSGLILDQHYLLEHVIAKGGFATVYLAQDVKDGGSVAVKLFQQPAREGSWLAKRLAGEIESMQRLQHPSVVKLLHHGLGPDERPYLVMEYIHGVTLRQSLRQGSIEAGRAVRIISQTLSALEEVHRQGILHRDLKPENIVLRNAGTADEVAMLIDFGVATVYEEILDGQKSTYFAGSLDYVSPEQVAGLKLEASDVFSMGAVCFEILSGCRLKLAVGQGDGETVILEKLQLAGVARPREVAAVLVNATAIEHSRRTAKIRDFKTDLLDALSG